MIKRILQMALLLWLVPVGAFAAWQDVTWTNAVNVSVSANTITKNVATAAWDAGAISSQTVPLNTDGGCRFTPASTVGYRMLGIGYTDSSQSYTDIDYALYAIDGGSVQIYENGVLIGTYGTYSAGQVMSVERVGTAVKYYVNGVLKYTSTVPSTDAFFCDSSIFTDTASISSVQIDGAGTPPTWETTPSVTTTAQESAIKVTWNEANVSGGVDGDERYALYIKATSTAPTSWTLTGYRPIGDSQLSMYKERDVCDSQTVKVCTVYIAGLDPSTQFYVVVRAFNSTASTGSAWDSGGTDTATTPADSAFVAYTDHSYTTLGTGLTGETFTSTQATAGNIEIATGNLTGTYMTGEITATSSRYWSNLQLTSTIPAGATITFQAEVCATTCSGTFIGPDGTSATNYDLAGVKALSTDLPKGTKLQLKFTLTRSSTGDTLTLNSIAVHSNEFLQVGTVDHSATFGTYYRSIPQNAAQAVVWNGRNTVVALMSDNSTAANNYVYIGSADINDQEPLDNFAWLNTGVIGGLTNLSEYSMAWTNDSTMSEVQIIGANRYRTIPFKYGVPYNATTSQPITTCPSSGHLYSKFAYAPELTVDFVGSCTGDGDLRHITATLPINLDPDTPAPDSAVTIANLTDTIKVTGGSSYTSQIDGRFVLFTTDDSSGFTSLYWMSYDGTTWTTPVQITDRVSISSPDGDFQAITTHQTTNTATSEAIAMWGQYYSGDYGVAAAVWDGTSVGPKTMIGFGANSEYGVGVDAYKSAAFDPATRELIAFFVDSASSKVYRSTWDIDNDTFTLKEVWSGFDGINVTYSMDRLFGAFIDSENDTIHPFFEKRTPMANVVQGTVMSDGVGVRGVNYNGARNCDTRSTNTICVTTDNGGRVWATLIANGAISGSYNVGELPGPDHTHDIGYVFTDSSGYVYIGWANEYKAETDHPKMVRSTFPLTSLSYTISGWTDVSYWFQMENPTRGYMYPYLGATTNGDLYMVFRCIKLASETSNFCTTHQNLIVAFSERKDITTITSDTTSPYVVTVTVTGHGYTSGDRIDLIGTDLDNAYTISNVTTNTYDITLSAPYGGCSSSCGDSRKWYHQEVATHPAVDPAVTGGQYLLFISEGVLDSTETMHIMYSYNAQQGEEVDSKMQHVKVKNNGGSSFTVTCMDGTDVTSSAPFVPNTCTSPFPSSTWSAHMLGGSMALDSNDYPHMAMVDLRAATAQDVLYTRWTGSAWASEITLADTGQPTAIFVDQSNNDVSVLYSANGVSRRESTDGGATFAAAEVLIPPPSFTSWVLQFNLDDRGGGDTADLMLGVMSSEHGIQDYYTIVTIGSGINILPILIQYWW